MFVTLRANGKRSADPGMQELALKKARPGDSRGHYGSSRRSSCVNCRAKKLRCQGQEGTCSRCESQGLACEAPAKRKPAERLSPAPKQAPSRTDIAVSGSRMPTPSASESVTSGAGGPSSLSRSSLGNAATRDSRVVAPTRERPTNETASTPTVPEQSPSGPSFPQAAASAPLAANVSSRPRTETSYTQLLSSASPVTWLDPNYSAHSASAINTADLEGILLQNQAHLSVPMSQCSCILDAVDIAASLDDASTLLRGCTFDEILRHQKHIILNALRPIACATCSARASSYTATSLLCEKLEATFRCLCARLNNTLIFGSLRDPSFASFIVPPPAVDRETEAMAQQQQQHNGGNQPPPPPPPQPYKEGSRELLHAEPCNSSLFSPQFKEQYSGKEQYHMARALAKVQLRNFTQLLTWLGETEHTKCSAQRRAKVQALKAGVVVLMADMEEGFRRILDTAAGDGA